MKTLYKAIIATSKLYNADKVTLFGSRARGDNNERSDIDLAIFNMPREMQSDFYFAIEDLPTLLKFDIVYISIYTELKLIENINKDGIVLYELQK